MADTGKPATPWDQRLANDATMAEHCIKLGGVVLKPPKEPTGFGGKP